MSKEYKIDEIDKKIISILKNKGRIQWREIGEEIHMTGQAVGERIRKMTKYGIIKGYHVTIDNSKIEETSVDYVTVIMTSGNHDGFIKTVTKIPEVTEVYRTSGHGCYMLKTETKSKQELEDLLQVILKYGNYQVNSVIAKYK